MRNLNKMETEKEFEINTVFLRTQLASRLHRKSSQGVELRGTENKSSLNESGIMMNVFCVLLPKRHDIILHEDSDKCPCLS